MSYSTCATERMKPFHSSRASAVGICKDKEGEGETEKQEREKREDDLQVFICFLTVNLIFPSFITRMSLAASKLRSGLQSSVSDFIPLRSSFSTY